MRVNTMSSADDRSARPRAVSAGRFRSPEPIMAEDIRQPDPMPDEPAGLPFLVVGVGASAGGLEAYSELLETLSPSPGLALLLVSHLDPGQKSHLTEILSRVSKMQVIEATDGMAIQVNHVHVIPPGTNMAM